MKYATQLINATTDEHIWTGSFDRTIRDVLELQAEVSNEIAREVKVALPLTGRN